MKTKKPKPLIGKVTTIVAVEMESLCCGRPVVTEDGGYLIFTGVHRVLRCENCLTPTLLPKKLRL